MVKHNLNTETQTFAGLLVSLCSVGGHGFVQRLKLFLVLDDGLGVDLDARDFDVDSSPFPRTFG